MKVKKYFSSYWDEDIRELSPCKIFSNEDDLKKGILENFKNYLEEKFKYSDFDLYAQKFNYSFWISMAEEKVDNHKEENL